jgi:hypothetical protein
MPEQTFYMTPRYRMMVQVTPVAQVGRYDIVQPFALSPGRFWAVTGDFVGASPRIRNELWEAIPEADRELLIAAMELLR